MDVRGRGGGQGAGDRDPKVVDQRHDLRYELHRRRLRATARVRRWLRRFGRSVLIVTLLILAALAWMIQSDQGQEVALDFVLGQVRGALAGELTVGDVRSGTLLSGATLTGVRLDTDDGRPFLTADSVALRYSIARAVIGGPPIRSTVIYGLDLEISKYSEEQALNLTRLIHQGAPTPDSVRRRPGRPLRLGRVAIRNGRVNILSPAAPGSRAPTVEGPGGETLRRIGFDGLSLDVEDATLAPDNAIQFEARLASFTADITILDEPLQLREAFGAVTYGARGVRITDGAYRLGESLLRGDVTVGPSRPGEPWSFRSDLETDGWAELGDVHWVDARIPDGRYRGGARISAGDGDVVLDLSDVVVSLEASDLVFDGTARFTDELSMQGMRVSANPVVLERLEPWLRRDLPLDGWLTGEATFDGTLNDLTARGRVTLVPTGFGGSPTTADFDGTLRRGERLGASEFQATLDPLNYTVLDALWPELPWSGRGSGTVALDGDAETGLSIDGSFVHTSPGGLESRARARGVLTRDSLDTWFTDVEVDLMPLSVGLFAEMAPQLGLASAVTGPVDLEGPLDALRIRADLAGEEGGLAVDATLDVLDPRAFYRIEAVADSLSLDRMATRLPGRTRWSGRLDLEGSGFDPDSVEARATLLAGHSRLGAVRVDTVVASLRMSRGMLIADSMRASVGGLDVTGRGRLGLVEGRWGSAQLDFNGATLAGLRPFVMGVGDTVLVQDGLSELDREFLRLQGVEPDTLPSALDVRLEGRVEGAASVSGRVGDIDIGMIVDVVDGRYQRNQVDTVRIGFTATNLPATTGAWQIGASAQGIVWEDRVFQRGGFEADMFERSGDGRIELVRRPGEQYRAVGSFAFDSAGGEINLSDASIQVDEQQYLLAQEALMRWDSAGLRVDSLEVTRAGQDPMYMLVDGVLARGGRSDFGLLVQGLHTEQIAYLLQLDDLPVAGHLDVDLRVRGDARSPLVEGTFNVLGAEYGALALTEVEGTLDYRDRRATFEVEGRDLLRQVLRSQGVFPVDLGFGEVESRVVEAPMDISLAMDSLDAAIALSYLSTLEGVVGTVSGDVRIRGTPDAPEPEGEITLRDGAWTIDAIGVRHSGVNGVLTLLPDRTVDVSLSAAGTGTSEVSGTIDLEPFSNPELDLTFDFDGFQAVSRPDIEGLVSGSFELTGRYRRPLAEGALTVDVGTIYADELQRAAGVVDLSDPFLFEQGLAVDTTALVSQPLFAGLRNPFFDNLRVDVDLSVPRGTWLRSIDTNVELTGDLLVRYDRSEGDFVLIGELQAARGSHRVLGRSFELDGGRVLFIGRPGLNPDLDIQASTRIRRPDDVPFIVQAQVGGTLVQPVVTLTSEETGLAEEDLISYLVFGQPSGALGGRSGAELGQVRGTGTFSPLAQGAVTFIGGAFANQLGSAISQELGVFSLDYVSVQQGGVQTLGADLVDGTQLELGRYLGSDVFLVLVLRPFNTGARASNTVAGVRVEVALTDDYNVEGFFEDRFLRSSGSLLGSSTAGLLQDQRILGVFLFREWGFRLGGDPQPPP